MRRVWFVITTVLLGVLLCTGTAVAKGPHGSGSFAPAAPMSMGRGYFTATELLNGNVLVAGGWGFDPAAPVPSGPPPVSIANAEIYHPGSATWSPAASMTQPRAAASAVRLPNGRVLVVGGMDAGSPPSTMASAEIYDPKTNTWTPTGSLHFARFEDVPAVLLPGGRVLVTGGFADTNFPTPAVLASTEIWNPHTGQWTTGDPMPRAPRRVRHGRAQGWAHPGDGRRRRIRRAAE